MPKNVEENKDLPFYAPGEADQVIAATGIVRRHVTTPEQTASDLGLGAAVRLIEALGWEKDTIDLLAFCTQNPDYQNHPDSFVVHEKLGLPERTMCMDFYHGCPGWVVSLSAVSSMLSSGVIKRAILIDSDTVTKDYDKGNREERPLFGDAGTATALEYCPEAKSMFFNIGTQSEDGRALAREIGGYRTPFTVETLQKDLERKAGRLTGQEGLDTMDSMDVFSFAITKVPKALKKLLAEYGIELGGIDNLVLHQANKVILENIAKRLSIPMENVPLGLINYGNTTSASIPLAMVTERGNVMTGYQRNLVCGFGTGLSWGAAYLETENVICPAVIEI